MMSPLSLVALPLAGLVAFLLLLARLRRPGAAPAPAARTVLLFEGEDLVDATGPALADPGLAGAARAGRGAALAALGRRFPDLAARLAAAGDGGATLASPAGERLAVTQGDGFTRLTLTVPAGPGDTGLALRLASLEDELRILRPIAEDCPQPIWSEDRAGRVLWANRAYLDLADRLLPPPADGIPPWPLRPIFPADAGPGTPVALTPPGAEEPLWFDIRRVPQDGGHTGFASDATRIVAAEAARTAFVQTLTRTFADLRTGLAVFDRRRRLVLFNPAFPDLTGLRPDYLLRRPHVRNLLDRLREAQILPEPRDWSSWRNHLATLQARAEDGTYCENWSLPDGRTYRITGRPHPDGALAFFIEDISDEIALNRHLRRGQEAVQAVLDRLPQALAVFSGGGGMILCNAAYARLWDLAPERPQDHPLAQELARWRAAGPPNPLWTRLAEVAVDGPDPAAAPVEEVIALTDGRSLRTRLTALGAGRLSVEFHEIPPADTGPRILLLG